MKFLIRLEELALFGLGVAAFALLDLPWWLFVVLLLAPDLSAAGYLVGPRIGAALYNLVHHRGVALVVYATGLAAASQPLTLAGVILFAHSSLDRVFGFGLKYADAFQHTHLGWIGETAGKE